MHSLGGAGGSTGVHLDGDGVEDLAIGALGHLVTRLSGQSKPRVVPLAPDFSVDVVTTGDFDGNGLDDVAVADPWAVVSDIPGAGTVTVVPSGADEGTSAGLRLDQEVSGVPDHAERGDHFGSSLAAADFDGDGYDDLAVGVPGETDDTTGAVNAGMVVVVPGGAGGLDPTRTRALVPNVAGIAEKPMPENDWAPPSPPGRHRRGPPTSWSPLPATGLERSPEAPAAVFVLPGPAGPTGAGASVVRGTGLRKRDIRQGAARDVTGDGRADVVVGSSGTGCGRVDVLAGTDRGIEATAVWTVDQDSKGVTDSCEDGEFWGQTLATGDLDGDQLADVVVGNPQERVAGHPEAGACTVLPGTPSGTTGKGAYLVTQDTKGFPAPRDGTGSATPGGPDWTGTEPRPGCRGTTRDGDVGRPGHRGEARLADDGGRRRY